MKNLISISDKAASQIKKIISSSKEEVLGIIVGVDKSGCSGYAYKLDYAKNIDPLKYEVIEKDGIKIFIEPIKKIGLFFWKKGDINTIDRYGPDGLSRLVKIISNMAINFQSGYLYHYAFVMLVGVSILLTYFILY